MNRKFVDDVANGVIGAAIEVHRHLGPGLLESTYELALSHELELRGYGIVRQAHLPVRYKGLALDAAYRVDLLVSECVVVELKVVDRLTPLHDAQLLTYMRHGHFSLGLLLNFNATVLRDGIRRLVNQH